MSRSAGLSCVLWAWLWATSAGASSGGSQQVVAMANGEMLDWAAARAPFECRDEAPKPCVARLRAALRAELQGKLQARAMPQLPCGNQQGLQCMASNDGCMPRAGLILESLLEQGPAASAAVPEVLEVAKRRHPSLEAHTFRFLAMAHRPEALPLALERLSSDAVTCRWEAFQMIPKMGAQGRQAIPRLVELLDEGDWKDREDIVKLLGVLGGPEVVGPLRRALSHPPVKAQASAALALAELGELARPAVPELTQLASSHWSAEVRERAAAAATRLSGRNVSHRAARCDVTLTPLEKGWKAKAASETISLRAVDGQEVPAQAQGPCSAFRTGSNGGKGRLTVLSEGRACVVGLDVGEWGGTLTVYEGGRSQVLRKTWYLNPYALVRTAGQLWVLEGMQHMGANEGGVSRVLRDPEGRWRAEPVAELPGTPVAHGIDSGGRLVVLSEDGRQGNACTAETGERPASAYLLRILADGSVEAVR